MSYPPGPPGPPSGGPPPGSPPPQWTPPGAPQPPVYGAPPPPQGYAPAPPGYGGPPTQPHYPVGPGGPPQKSNTGLILGIIIGLLVLGGGGAAAFFLLTGDEDAADTTTTLTTAVTTTVTTAATTTSSPVTTPTTVATTTSTTAATTTTPVTLATTTTTTGVTTTTGGGTETPTEFTSGAADVSWENALTGANPYGFESSVDSGAGYIENRFTSGDGSAIILYVGTPLAAGAFESTDFVADPTTLRFEAPDGTEWVPDGPATGGACSINLGVADPNFVTGNFDCDTTDGSGAVLTLHGSFVVTAGASATGLTGEATWTLGGADANWTGAQEDSGVFGFESAGVASDAGDLFSVNYTDANGAELTMFVGIPQSEGTFSSLNYQTDAITLDLTTDDGTVWIPDGEVADTQCEILIFYVNAAALAASFDCTLSNAAGDNGDRLEAHGTVVAYNESMMGN